VSGEATCCCGCREKALLPPPAPEAAIRGFKDDDFGVEASEAVVGRLMSGDLNGFLSVVLAVSTRRRLEAGSGVCDDMAGTSVETHFPECEF